MNSKHSAYELSREDGTEAVTSLLEDRSPAPGKHEKEAKDKEEVQVVGLFQLFRYADAWDKLLMLIGTTFAVVHGMMLPSMLIVFSKSFDAFVESNSLQTFLYKIHDYMDASNLTDLDVIKNPDTLDQSRCDDVSRFYGGNITCRFSATDGIYSKMEELGVYFFILGCVIIVCGYMEFAFWTMTGERQAKRIRGACLHNVLHQNIGWFDAHKTSELNTRLADDIFHIQDGLGSQVGALIRNLVSSFACLICGFVFGRKVSLVVLAACPLMFLAGFGLNKLQVAFTAGELREYAKAGGIAEEVFGAIRTVVAFGGQAKEATRYFINLSNAAGYGAKKAVAHGVNLAVVYWFILINNALGFWYGGKLCRDEPDDYSPDDVMIAIMCLLASGFLMAGTAPSLQTVAKARGAAHAVFGLIQLKSPIDSSDNGGKKPAGLKGVIEFRNVHFNYPVRRHVKVLNDVSVEIHPGQTVALVGASGCGKSTIVQLVLRFYDPDYGQILLDGQDIKELNIKWLRQNIGLVSQEPVLFATSIAENIRYGREGVTKEEIVTATKTSNAYDFIMQLPQQFETFVGEGGAQLSGGQKQRIAIARALVRDPKILLLDEATSSLDTESESIVQEALDKACQGRTTVIIAHRLSTIKHADVIFGCQNGQVVERGTHDVLMGQKGIYYQLVMKQSMSDTKENEESEEDDTDEYDDNGVEEANSKKTSRNGLNQLGSVSEVQKIDKDNDDEDDKDLPKAPFLRLLKMNFPEWYYIILGCFGSAVSGLFFPAFSLLFSDMMAAFGKDKTDQSEEFETLALKLVVLGFINLLVFFLQAAMFGLSGEALTVRLRDLTFRAMLKQDIAWFDDPKNSVGALTTRLSTDASQVHGATGIRVGSLLMSLSGIVSTLVIAFTFGWKMTFVLLAFLPFMSIGDVIRVKIYGVQSEKVKEALEGAGKITVESIANIRTVASLSKEETFYSQYMETLETVHTLAMRNAHLAGIAFSFSLSVIYFFYGASFIFGAYMIEEGEMSTRDVFRTFNVVLFGAMAMAAASAFAPDLGKAEMSAKRILHMLDSPPSIDPTSTGGKKLTNDYPGNLSFNDVNFHYPSRQTIPVLQDMSFSVSPGQTVALVGRSGCGKSTSVSLIERFYDTVSGSVCLDNNDIKTLNVEWLRSQMALVSQEPALFDQTIAENIAFGDNTRVVSMDEIVVAARTANIHTFITSLPDGYETIVGSKGTQLSGGQKQRIAIARALIRNPKILLLDEATSALDTDSETVVQEALDKACTGRACVVIAHRLSTVQNADKICVLGNGMVLEQGTHRELMALKGFYHKLVEKSLRK